MILTVDELREHIQTALGDDALQRMLDDAEAQIVRLVGEPGARTERVDGGFPNIVLDRPIASVTTVTEATWGTSVASAQTLLAADDYRFVAGGYVLERLRTGTTSRYAWGPAYVDVLYTPVDDDPIRIGVQIDLCKLSIASNPALFSQTIGAWTEVYRAAASSEKQMREDILSRLVDGPRMAVI